MWIDDRGAIKWIEQENSTVARLAADAILLSTMTYQKWRRANGSSSVNAAASASDLPLCIRRCSKREIITKQSYCACEQQLCGSKDQQGIARPQAVPVRDPRAPFSDSFCLWQASLASSEPFPSWVKRRYRGKTFLNKFWNAAADTAASPVFRVTRR